MVVSEDKPLVRHRNTGTPTAKDYNGTRKGRLIQIVEIIHGHIEPQFTHPIDVLLIQLVQDPHTFIGTCSLSGYHK